MAVGQILFPRSFVVNLTVGVEQSTLATSLALNPVAIVYQGAVGSAEGAMSVKLLCKPFSFVNPAVWKVANAFKNLVVFESALPAHTVLELDRALTMPDTVT